MSLISDQLIPWQKKYGRNDLPWQGTRNPYFIWVSEIMLQQTQVKTVLPYYQKFLTTFPDIRTLALANEEDIMELWSGLGYYARARNLHESAKIIHNELKGKFPSKVVDLLSLPGIGRSSAGAICSFAYNQKTPILDGNVKRVFTRIYGIKDYAGISSVEKKLWNIAEENLPESEFGKYNQALMDLGSSLCKKKEPQCSLCPVNENCKSFLYKWTDVIPASKPKKKKLTQVSYFYIFQYKTKFLFFKKPNEGIWGGLWSLPEFKKKLNIKKWIPSNLKIKDFKLLDDGFMFSEFTHFKLQMNYQHFVLNEYDSKIILPNSMWQDKLQIQKGAYPAPIKKLVKNLPTDLR